VLTSGGGGANLSMSGVDTYLDMEGEKLRAAQKETTAKREEIMGILDAMEDKRCARLLVYRYISEFPPSWEDIADWMKRDRKTVRRWHDAALLTIEIPENNFENAP